MELCSFIKVGFVTEVGCFTKLTTNDQTLQGYYSGAILKFRLTFPPNYPERPPDVHFITDVFHPLVSQQDGLFSLTPRLPNWRSVKRLFLIYILLLILQLIMVPSLGRPKEHHVFDVLFWIKSAFKKQALDQIKEKDCLNKEAFR